ncbi:hypothetical protein GCM10010218_12920 [Streptomyces mashuensis]|uniref:RusA-like resolvase n=1 Tax=Streptomyces mashuensis TaxID=33904 RepID=A0A919EBD0_9ACTN|nr:hypothetical protein [Streptomyces mashuensis]GHF33242.1 hypothetical protein GCM10010218_12920 [Streptomyces mashuensis]
MEVRTREREFVALTARLVAGRASAAATPKKKRCGRKAVPLESVSVPEPPDLSTSVSALPGAGRSWTLLMPYGELLTSNQRLHHMAEYRVRKRLRQEAALTARAHRLPRLERAAVYYVLHPRPIKRKRDPGNWAPTAKAYVDGLVDAGLVPDDNSDYLVGPYPEMGRPVTTGGARISLVVVELAPVSI